jgi:hypothetical protein
MDQVEFLVRDAPAIGPGVMRIQLECSHGRTFGLLLAGSKPIADPVVLDLLRVRHDRQNGCHCTTVLRPGIPEAGSGADAHVLPTESHGPAATTLERSDA